MATSSLGFVGMKALKIWSQIVTIALWAIAILLAHDGVIPWWLAVLIVIASIFLGGYITLLLLRVGLGAQTFRQLMTRAREEQAKERQIKEIIRNADQKAAQKIREVIEPLEAQFSAEMKELSTKTELGYLKASAAYLAGGSDPDYERHMKSWYRQMKLVLSDQSNPQAAATLRTTLENEYTNVTMPPWDKAEIAKLLAQATKKQIDSGKDKKMQATNAEAKAPEKQEPVGRGIYSEEELREAAERYRAQQDTLEEELREWYKKHPR